MRLSSGASALRSPTFLRITLHPHYVRKPNTLADPQSYTFVKLYFSLSLVSHEKQWTFFFMVYERNSGNTGPQLDPLNSGSRISEHREPASTVDIVVQGESSNLKKEQKDSQWFYS